MTRKRIGFFIFILGILLILGINSLDFLRGKAFSLGPLQIGISVLGLLIMLLGGVISFTQISIKIVVQSCLKAIDTFILRIYGWFTSRIHPKFLDILIISGFVVYATIYSLGRWNGSTPFIFLGSDASYISSYAAALDHPGQFASDYFLSNTAHVSSYLALHIPLIRLLNKLVGSYGNAFLVLLPITIFLKLFGFYYLGKRLFKNRGLALLLAIITFPIVYTGAWDYWGLVGDVLPRNLFEILFPWLIVWSIEWIDKPNQWYLLSFILGLMTYVHSISAGIVFFTLSFIYLCQSSSPFLKRMKELFINVAIYLIAIIPFVLIYTYYKNSAKTVPISYQESISILNDLYGQNHIDTLSIFLNLLKQLTFSGILPLALFAILLILIIRKFTPKRTYSILGFWILGIITISVIVPYIEKLLDSWLQMLSVQMMLARGLRFLPPLLLIFILFIFHSQIKNTKFPNLVMGLCVSLVIACFFVITSYNKQDPYFNKEIKCLSSAKLVCPSQQELDGEEIIHIIESQTTKDETILAIPPLSVPFTLAIRYQALRPLGYTQSDVTRMSDDPGLQEQINQSMRDWKALEHVDIFLRLKSYLSLAKKMKADYLIIQKNDFPPQTIDILAPIYENESYALVRIVK